MWGIVLIVVIIIWVIEIFRCKHKYELIDTVRVTNRGIVTGYVYVQRCKECGKIVEKRVQ